MVYHHTTISIIIHHFCHSPAFPDTTTIYISHTSAYVRLPRGFVLTSAHRTSGAAAALVAFNHRTGLEVVVCCGHTPTTIPTITLLLLDNNARSICSSSGCSHGRSPRRGSRTSLPRKHCVSVSRCGCMYGCMYGLMFAAFSLTHAIHHILLLRQ